MRSIHFCAGLGESNGMAVAAGLLAKEQGAALADARDVCRAAIDDADEVWVHSCWLPCVWRACWLALRARKRLVRMLHGNLDPVRFGYHGWKKRLAGPIERYFLRRADVVVATCEAEAEWIRAYLGKRCPPIEVTDIKRFFKLGETGQTLLSQSGSVNIPSSLHLLYLGRRHPLKGLGYLESAIKQLSSDIQMQRDNLGQTYIITLRSPPSIQLKVVSNAFGEEKEKIWNWCDALILPTLSENFGLVIAEALERGKRVITTDGAPAWPPSTSATEDKGDGNDYGGRLVYLKGYRDGLPEDRVRLLKNAIKKLIMGKSGQT